MSVASVVLIVAENEAQAVKSEPGFETDIRVFADTDAIKARQLITRDRPRLVVLGRAFVDTVRGAALVNAIRTDQTLPDTQIRVLAQVSDYLDLVSERAVSTTLRQPDSAFTVATPCWRRAGSSDRH